MSSDQHHYVSDKFASFLAARGKITRAKHTPAGLSHDVECVEISVASKCKTSQDIASLSSLRRGRLTHDSAPSTAMVPCREIVTNTDTYLVIEELKAKVFSHDFESLEADGTATIASIVYNDLVQAMSSYHLMEIKLSSTIVEVAH
ncbi:PREDICTED: uncharacterized protein LOC104757726 [Camelina sativa]|uniref:Uncharacterized protein LOC104757726 n=1 Tax=Camelina sativa TaxID=90675 RepID=A0ABM0X0F2_CAMSA|nr:PREDICTED: uncharacterized protein LOC104757726 [Camelina sativa]